MEDLRKIKSKDLLKNAFWHVLAKKNYAHIYIKDIVEEAGINRKTFVAHYDSVDTLMRECVGELISKLLLQFYPTQDKIIVDFSYSTRKYTQFALENKEQLQLIFSNHLDSVALHMWKQHLLSNSLPSTTPQEDLRSDLLLNYTMYCCWGNLLWVLDHTHLPLDTLVSEALDVYQFFIRTQVGLYDNPEYGTLSEIHSPLS